MDERLIRRETRELLQQLDVIPPLDSAELVQRIAEHRARPIRLQPHPIPADGPLGACIPDEHRDWIFYQAVSSPPHQAHIIAHELGHLLCGHVSNQATPHRNGDVVTAEAARERYPDIDPKVVARALHRECYDDQQEVEAETVASVIYEWASVLDSAEGGPSAGEARSLDTALTDPLGWR